MRSPMLESKEAHKYETSNWNNCICSKRTLFSIYSEQSAYDHFSIFIEMTQMDKVKQKVYPLVDRLSIFLLQMFLGWQISVWSAFFKLFYIRKADSSLLLTG